MSPLPDDLQGLLNAERERDALGDDALDATWLALRANVTKIESGEGTGEPPSPRGTEATPPGRTSPQPLASPAWALKAAAVAASALMFGAGVLVGRATVDRAPVAAPPPPATVALAPPVTATASASAESLPPASAASSITEPLSPRATGPLGASHAERPTAATTTATGAASAYPSAAPPHWPTSALSSKARTALLRGRAGDALTLARKHEATFPRGGLAEDRDFLIVSALHELGQADAARAKAAAFVARYPKSALRNAAEAMGK